MERWEYQVLLVNKWGRAMRPASRSGTEPWEFDDTTAADLVSLLAELGTDGWELVGIDTNVSYGQSGYSYVGSLYIFQRPLIER
jgi:hypothetical protein